MSTFEEQVTAFYLKTVQKIDLTVKEAILLIGINLVDRSPVGDPTLWISNPPKGYVGGHFKANWQGGSGSPNYQTTDDIDPTGEISITNISQAIPEKAGGVFYITNSLPYAQRLEDGWSSQAPQGMVKLTELEFPQIMAQAKIKAEAI
jgi:hypothetical protein